MAITVTPTLELGNVPPRVRLDVAASAGEVATTLNRINSDGSTTPVRTVDGAPLTISAGVGLVYDYEAPFGEPVEYTSLESPSISSSQVTVTAARVWLEHPGVPALSIPVLLGRGSFTQRTNATKQAVFYPMGRATPVVFTDGARKSAQSQLVLITTTATEAEALGTLLADASPLLLNIPADMGYNFSTCYISVGDVSSEVATPLVFESYLTWTLPFTVVDRPVGGTQSQRTWVDIVTNFATWADVMAAYPTWRDLLAGP